MELSGGVREWHIHRRNWGIDIPVNVRHRRQHVHPLQVLGHLYVCAEELAFDDQPVAIYDQMSRIRNDNFDLKNRARPFFIESNILEEAAHPLKYVHEFTFLRGAIGRG